MLHLNFNKQLFLGCFIWTVYLAPQRLTANAGLFINPAVHYHTEDLESKYQWGDSNEYRYNTILNTTLGYNLGDGLLFGLKYLHDIYETDNVPFWEENSGSSDKITSNVVGAGVGFFVDKLSFFISILSNPYRKNTMTQVVHSKGSGTMIDMIYLIDLGGFYIGPQLSWINIKYKKYDGEENDNLEDVFISMEQTKIEPYIGLFYFL